MASVKRRPDGVWRARYRDPAGKEHTRHFELKRDAERWLSEQVSTIHDGRWVDPRAGRITFETYFAQWAQHQVWTATTQKAMSLAVRSTSFRDMEIRRIDVTHVEAWVKSMTVVSATRTKPLEPSTIKTRVMNVRNVFRSAVRAKVIAVDPCEGVTLPRRRKREAAMQIPSPEVVGRLLAAADERFAAFVAVCAFAGLRLGEAAALKVSDVDFLRRQIHVDRQVQRAGGGEVEISLPKYNSERVVQMPDELAEILARHLELPHRNEWLFAGVADDPPHQNTVGYWWRKTQTAAGVSGQKLHNLRHFYASGLIADGCDVVTVQRALGHAKASTTLDTYSHLWPSAEDRTRKAAGSLARAALGTSLGISADSVRTEGPN